MSLLSCENISFSYGGKNLFSQLSFTVQPQEFWVISGESGIGKSTLLKVLTGELNVTSGKVNRLVSFSEIRQNLALCDDLSAVDSIAAGSLGQLPWWKTFFSFPPDILRQSKDLAASLKIDHVLKQNISKLSGGEKQRVAMARSLLGSSKIFIIDEPISMLDEERAWESLLLMKDQVFARGGSLICVLHQTHFIQKLATHQILMGSQYPDGWKLV